MDTVQVIVDKCIITKMGPIIKIETIETHKKRNKNFNPDNVRRVTTGSRVNDCLLIANIDMGGINALNTILAMN